MVKSAGEICWPVITVGASCPLFDGFETRTLRGGPATPLSPITISALKPRCFGFTFNAAGTGVAPDVPLGVGVGVVPAVEPVAVAVGVEPPPGDPVAVAVAV